MIDERIVGIMRYDEGKRFAEVVQPSEPAETYVACRDVALQHAVSLHKWVAEHQEPLLSSWPAK